MMDHTALLGVILFVLHLGDTRHTFIAKKGYPLAIGGSSESAEVVNPVTSCDLPQPERKASISVTTRDGKTLVCGGAIPHGGYTASCKQFNYKTKTWDPFNSLTSEYRTSASVVTLSNGVYVLGGYGEASTTSDFLPTGSSKWIPGPTIPGKPGKGGVFQSCVAKLDDFGFIVLGGYYNRTQVLLFNEDTGRWTELPNLTEGVYRQSCIALNDKILMAGGYTDRGYTGRTLLFDRSVKPREVAPLRNPRGLAAMEVFQGKPVILGGYDGSVRRSDGERWNKYTEKWEKTGISLKRARMYFSLVTLAEDINCD